MIDSAGPIVRRIFPERLRTGDTIAIVGPASPPGEDSKLQKGRAILEERGYRVVDGAHLGHRRLLFCGRDEERADDINRAFADPSIKAIFCAMGGCGTSRILPFIDFETIRRNPKIFVGYSDITSLHIAITQETGLATFYGPMVATEMGSDWSAFTEKHFFDLLADQTRTLELDNLPGRDGITLYEGTAEGDLTGGCLSIVAATLGTPYEINTKGKILFLEDIDEFPHRVDRYLVQLIQAKKMEQAEGIVFGTFTRCEYPPGHDYSAFGVRVLDIARENSLRLEKPCIWGLQFGHTPEMLTIPVGARARLDASNRRLIVEPSVR